MIFSKFFNHSSNSITGAAIIIAAASLINKFVGLGRDRILAHYYGAGPVMDAYYAAFRFPDLIYNLLVVGALTAGFIPVFSRVYHAATDKSASWRLSNNLINTIGVILVALAITGMVFSRPLSIAIAPGMDDATRAMCESFIRIMFWSPVLLGVSMVMGGILQSLRRFVLYSIAPIFYNLGIIFGVTVLVPLLGLRGLALGVVLGAFLHFVIQTIGARDTGWRWRPTIDWKDRDMRAIWKLMIPRTLGLAVSNINLIVITMLASLLPAGAIAAFSYANNLQWVPIGIIGIPFALAVFPVLSQKANARDRDGFTENLLATIRQIIFLVAPLSIIFILLRAQIVRVILGSGAFDWTATISTADALAYFSLGLLAQSIVPVLTRAFFAHENTRTPFLISIATEIVTLVSSWALMRPMGVSGLALGSSIGATVNLALLWTALRPRLTSAKNSGLIRSLAIVSLSTLTMSIVTQALKYPLARVFDLDYFWGVFGQGAIAGTTGLLVYCLICSWLKLPEFQAIQLSLKRKFLKIANLPAAIEPEVRN